MILVPGLFPQQSNLHTQQQVQQHKSQGPDHSPQRNLQLPRAQLIQQISQQMQQPHHQNTQHKPHQQHQYQQQHHNHLQNQQSQHQQPLLLKSEDVQQNQLTSKLSGQKHLGIGLQPQNEALQHHTIPQASNEQLQPQVTGAQMQPSQSGGMLMHQDLPNSQLLWHKLSQKSQQQQVPSPQQQQQSQSQNDSNSFPIEVQPEALLQGLQESQSQEKFQVPEQVAHSEDQ